jgi:hypothetical protein
MPSGAAASFAPIRGTDPLAAALYAAELGQPVELSPALVKQLFQAIPQLRVSVPYATLCVLWQLATDPKPAIRANVARALPWFAEVYADRAEALLLPLADDDARQVRLAAVDSLVDFLESTADRNALIARWQRYSGRTREVLERARQRLPPAASP